MKRNKIELSRKLRLKTLKPILEGKSTKDVCKELGLNIKTLKYRLTLLYKYYGVSNRYELMAQYIKFPSELYKHEKDFTIDRVRGKKEYSLLERWRSNRD